MAGGAQRLGDLHREILISNRERGELPQPG